MPQEPGGTLDLGTVDPAHAPDRVPRVAPAALDRQIESGTADHDAFRCRDLVLPQEGGAGIALVAAALRVVDERALRRLVPGDVARTARGAAPEIALGEQTPRVGADEQRPVRPV